jgi:hypothetical protein
MGLLADQAGARMTGDAEHSPGDVGSGDNEHNDDHTDSSNESSGENDIDAHGHESGKEVTEQSVETVDGRPENDSPKTPSKVIEHPRAQAKHTKTNSHSRQASSLSRTSIVAKETESSKPDRSDASVAASSPPRTQSSTTTLLLPPSLGLDNDSTASLTVRPTGRLIPARIIQQPSIRQVSQPSLPLPAETLSTNPPPPPPPPSPPPSQADQMEQLDNTATGPQPNSLTEASNSESQASGVAPAPTSTSTPDPLEILLAAAGRN